MSGGRDSSAAQRSSLSVFPPPPFTPLSTRRIDTTHNDGSRRDRRGAVSPLVTGPWRIGPKPPSYSRRSGDERSKNEAGSGSVNGNSTTRRRYADRTGGCQLTENSILRSRKRRDSGGSGGSVQCFPSEYVLPVQMRTPFLTFNRSHDREERWKADGSGGQNGQRVDGYVLYCARPEQH